MTRLLESYAAGRWYAASAEGHPLLDAATGEEVARISSAGLDLGAMAHHARTVGGPAIRELTFHERALLLKELATHLTGLKDEFYELSLATGATRRDSMIDIDGGFGTVFSYSSKGRRELPNAHVVCDGDLEQLGRTGVFLGQHVYTSRPGVAVQINAFNFPVWGMLEKLAPAFIAGLPTIVKPASQTAYLTELVVRRIIESGILPEGSLQLLAGSAGDLLDHLGVQDSVAFTGSAHTAGILRQHPSVLHGGVQLQVEADSLNCSVLGPDVTSSDPEWDLFVKGVVTEMTAKAGQKCTAIRRVIVPSAVADEMTDAIAARLATITVGDPGDESVRMGPLASLGQREEVRKAVEALRSSADVVLGDPNATTGFAGDGERGAFMTPVLLRARAGAVEPHDVEPFGPVSTVMSYDSLDEAVDARRARQGLARRLGRHPRPGGRPHPGARPRAVARPDPRARPRRRARVDGPRLSPADAGARRPRPRRRRRGARRRTRRAPPHAALGDPGLTRHAHRDHRPLDARLAAPRDARAPLPPLARDAEGRRHDRLRSRG